jgi:phosphatidylserine decarboxylase
MKLLNGMPSSLPTTPQAPTSVQPGGGFCMSVELVWGRLRRAYLRTFRPGYVRRMAEKRQGHCDRFPNDVIDPRDLKFIANICGYSFRPEDDAFAWRGRLGFARYGWAEIILFSLAVSAGLFLTALLAAWVHPLCGLIAVPFLLFWLEIIYFFRDPERPIPQDANALVSPADGVITNIETVDEPDFGPALRISIFLSIFNVHVNRLPRAGTVANIRYFPGAYLDARNPDSAKRNEQLWIDMTDAATRRPLRVKQISGAIARRIVCWLKPGDTVSKGARLGMIKLGSRTDLLLPPDAVKKVEVVVGAKVQGGLTILARV